MKPTLPLCLLLAASLTLPGCLRSEKFGDCTATGPRDFKGEALTILDHGAFDFAFEAIQPAFEKETCAQLKRVIGQDAGDALRQAIESRGNPIADVIYGVDNALIHQAMDADAFEPYESPRLSNLDQNVIDLDDFRQDGRVVATPADHGYISINYDAKLRDEFRPGELPDTLADLADPQWAGDLVVENPRLSSPGLGFLISTVATFGENDAYDYLDYWADLFDDGVTVVDDWTNAYVVHFSAGYGQYEEGFIGDKSLVVSYVTSPAAEAFYGGLDAPPSVSLEPPAGVFHQVETVAILDGTRHYQLATAFVDFVLSETFQNQTLATMAVYPVIEGLPIPDAYQRFATDPAQLEPARFTSNELEDGVPRWVEAWTDLYETERA